MVFRVGGEELRFGGVVVERMGKNRIVGGRRKDW